MAAVHRRHTTTTHCPAFPPASRHRGHHHHPPPPRDARITFETLVKLHCRGGGREAAEACTAQLMRLRPGSVTSCAPPANQRRGKELPTL